VAGYSATSLPDKLGIRAHSRVAVISAPSTYPAALGDLPEGVDVRTDARGKLDVVVFFVTRRAELTRRFPAMARAIQQDGGLWIAWPKKASNVTTDLSDAYVREVGLLGGLVDNKVCAIDETWSGLRFVHRVADRVPPRVAAQR
jgi:hypothetical protein